jgi:hypothetical protein
MSEALSLAVRTFVNTSTTKQTILAVTPQDTQQKLYDIFGQTDAVTLISHDISQLVDMFCCLFDQKRVGLRLTILDHYSTLFILTTISGTTARIRGTTTQ